MIIRQVSAFLENKSGRLADVTKILGDNGIDIFALSIADTTNFGILRLIVNDYEKASVVLKKAGMTVAVTEVLAISVPDVPGGLSSSLKAIDEKGVAIEYMYAFISKTQGEANVIIKVDDPEAAIETLKSADVKILDAKTVYNK